MSAKHTPGPWYAVGYWVEHPDDNRPDIATCNPADMGQSGRSQKEIIANVCLIAAAPDLLEALQDILDTGFAGGPQGKRARAAIAKATGGAA